MTSDSHEQQRLARLEREQQRLSHLVLGKPRPKAPAPSKRRAKKRPPVALSADIEARVAIRERWSHKQGTPETHEHAAAARDRPGSLARLYASGAIDADQLAAAEQIEAAHRAITADVRVRTASLEARVDSGGNRAGDGIEHVGRVRDQIAYDLWRGGFTPRDLAAVLAIVIDDGALTTVAAAQRMSVRRARQVLDRALSSWWEARARAAKVASAAR